MSVGNQRSTGRRSPKSSPRSPGAGGDLAERRHDQIGKRRRIETRRAALDRDRLIQRRALLWLTKNAHNDRFHLLRREFLAVLGAGGARDAFIHQRATEIV